MSNYTLESCLFIPFYSLSFLCVVRERQIISDVENCKARKTKQADGFLNERLIWMNKIVAVAINE
jgi:hypothetical protein